MKSLAIMQPYFFPYAGYFQLMASVDTFIVYDDVAFIKQGWIARNRILVNGQPHIFSIPVADASSFKLIKDTELHPRLFPIWRGKFLKTLGQAYKSAPHFKPVYTLVEEVLQQDQLYISGLATQSLKAVCSYLHIKTNVVETSAGYCPEFKGQDRIIAICKQEQATRYLNVPGGKELYSKEAFAENKIELSFIEPNLVPYAQLSDGFHPALSMIDVLMCNSKESCLSMLCFLKK